MRPFFAAFEQTSLSVWMREDPYAYFVVLILHAFGMALLVGAGLAISLRGLAMGGGVAKMRGFVPVLWWGGLLAVVSGVLLLAAYPAKALTNPLFAVKFACLIAACLLMRPLLRADDPARRTRALSALALALWLGGVAAGKLLLHTYRVLTVG